MNNNISQPKYQNCLMPKNKDIDLPYTDNNKYIKYKNGLNGLLIISSVIILIILFGKK